HKHRHTRQQCAMQQNKQGVGAGIELNRTGCPQSSRIARRQCELAEPLQRDDTEHEIYEAHSSLSTANPAVKPGPSAVSKARPHGLPAARLRASMRSSTNRTLAADMLPNSRKTSRASVNSAGISPKTRSNASSTFGPPGWQTKRSI